MKKILLIAALAVCPMAAMAAATEACEGGEATAITGATDGSKFVRVTFTPVCSANSFVQFDQNSTVLWGASGSAKGKNIFVGSTNGGSVKPRTGTGNDCGSDGCTQTEVSGGLDDVAPAS